MGLLDTFIQSIQDLNPEWTKDRLKTAAGLLADFTPVLGDVKAGYDMVDSARQGNYGEAALNGIGLLPFVPGFAGMAKITRQDVKPIAEQIAGKINDAGFLADLQHSGSAAGASSYIKALDPQTGRFIVDPIRVSDHSKGAFNNQFNRNISDTDDIDKVVNDYLGKLNELRSLGPSSGLLAQQKRDAEIAEKILNRARNRLKDGRKLSNQELSALKDAGEI